VLHGTVLYGTGAADFSRKIKPLSAIASLYINTMLFRLQTATEPVFGFPNLIRFSWSTTRELLEKSGACKVRWACDDEDTGGSEAITSFFQGTVQNFVTIDSTGNYTFD
jgi:hypothetical protein